MAEVLYAWDLRVMVVVGGSTLVVLLQLFGVRGWNGGDRGLD